MKLALIYPLAALAEIGGCFAFWAWLKLDRSPWWLVPGVISLIAFAWLLTLVPTETAGRAFAAYGGVYICASLAWMALVEKTAPDRWGLIGGAVCLIGAGVHPVRTARLEAPPFSSSSASCRGSRNATTAD